MKSDTAEISEFEKRGQITATFYGSVEDFINRLTKCPA